MNERVFKIGVDFDNTIVSYDHVIRSVAIEYGLIPENGPTGKKAIRDLIRLGDRGEIEWQKVQGQVYGPRMGEARLIDGVGDFFTGCRSQGIDIHIVSHKTEFANYDPTTTPLREVAVTWMEKHGFFDRFGFKNGDIYFAADRSEKVKRIGELGFSHFIDDLEEVFSHPEFPPRVMRILYTPDGHSSDYCDQIIQAWSDVFLTLFDDGN